MKDGHFIPPRPGCKDLRQVAKFCEPNLELAHQIYYYSVFVTVLFSDILFDLLIQFTAGYSCIRNNIVNVPARPTSVENYFFSLSGQLSETTKTYLVESVIMIKKKLSSSNG